MSRKALFRMFVDDFSKKGLIRSMTNLDQENPRAYRRSKSLHFVSESLTNTPTGRFVVAGKPKMLSRSCVMSSMFVTRSVTSRDYSMILGCRGRCHDQSIRIGTRMLCALLKKLQEEDPPSGNQPYDHLPRRGAFPSRRRQAPCVEPNRRITDCSRQWQHTKYERLWCIYARRQVPL